MNKRLGFIDALRGFAALFVILFHTVNVPKPALPLSAPAHAVIDLGFSGVTLFFVISAFTLCLTLDKRTFGKHWIGKFYLRRAGRILPLYLVWLAYMARIEFGRNVIHHKGEMLSYLFFTYNFQPGRQTGLVLASWTLGVEMVFYVIFPFLFIAFNNAWKTLLLLFITIGLSIAHYQLTRQFPAYDPGIGILYNLPVFVIGMIAYWVYANYLPGVTRRSALAFGLFSLFLALFVLSSFMRHDFKMVVPYILAFAYACLLLGLSVAPFTFIVNRVTMFIGVISYSLYLNHPRALYYLIPQYQKIYAWQVPEFFKVPLCFLATIIPVIVVSIFTYNFIEKPGANLIKRIGSYKRSTISAAS